MALNIEHLRKPATQGRYVSDKRLCLTADNRVVEWGDIDAKSLLVIEGGFIPEARARELGLIADESLDDDDEASPVDDDDDDDSNDDDDESKEPASTGSDERTARRVVESESRRQQRRSRN